MQEVILDAATTAREFNHNLKRIFKDELGLKVKVRIINSYNWPRVSYVEVLSREAVIPNEIRKMAVIQTYGKLDGVRNADDIHYGNTSAHHISLSPSRWNALFAEVLENKAQKPGEFIEIEVSPQIRNAVKAIQKGGKP